MQGFTGLKVLTGCLVLAHAAIAAAQPPALFRGDGERRPDFSDGDREEFVRRMRERMEERRAEGGFDRGGDERGRPGFGSFGGPGFGGGFGGGFGERGGGDRGFGGFGGGGFGGPGFFRGGPGFGGPGFGRGAPSGERGEGDERRESSGAAWPGGIPFGGGRQPEQRGSSSTSSSASSTQRSATETKKRARVTLTLPAAYEAGDQDRDGQIALHEWRRWKPQESLAEFRRLDLNGDGFLTPRELVKASGGPGSSSGSSGVQVATTQSAASERSGERRRER